MSSDLELEARSCKNFEELKQCVIKIAETLEPEHTEDVSKDEWDSRFRYRNQRTIFKS